LGEGRQLDGSLDAPVMAAGTFQVHQERQAFFEGEFCVFGIVELLLQAIPKGGQMELDEFVE
jgi:hypothetical protein